MESEGLGPEEYLLYEVIRQSHEISGDLPETQFHKLSFLAYKELEDEIDLPVYWYEHGIMVDLEEVIHSFLATEFASWKRHSGNRVVLSDEISADEFNLNPDLKNRVDSVVLRLVRRFKDVFDTSAIKNETYEKFAEDEYVLILNEFRYFLDGFEGIDTVDRDQYAPTDVSFRDLVSTDEPDHPVDISDKDMGKIFSYMNRMTANYPQEKYDIMWPFYKEWESLTRQFTQNKMLSQLGSFTNKFWNTFSNVELRIHYNENISRAKVHRWRKERGEHIERFENDIEDYRKTLLRTREESNILNSVQEEYNQSVEDLYQDIRRG